MNRHPRHVPFRSPQDIHDLQAQLFSPNTTTTAQSRAIERIIALETKTKLPHTLLSTAYLLRIHHQFLSVSFPEGSCDAMTLQLGATMALIRFVNGLLDPSQQSQFAIPLNLLAKKIGLPSWFVELRHAGTHEGLPSLEMLRLGVVGALDWLKNNYWDKLTGKIVEGDGNDGKMVDSGEMDEDWKEVLRKYRRLRRVDINRFIKVGDSSEEGKEYWKVVKILESGISKNEFYKVLMFKKCIINERYKWEQIKLLYEPLFLYLIKRHNDVFVVKILDKLMFKVYEFENKFTIESGDDDTYNEKEIEQVKSWCLWITEKINPDKASRVVEILGKTNQTFSIEVLTKLKTRGIELGKIDEKIQSIENFLSDKVNNTTPKRTNDDDDLDIFQDLENLKKRVKLNTTTKLPIKMFEKHTSWEPKPFGVL